MEPEPLEFTHQPRKVLVMHSTSNVSRSGSENSNKTQQGSLRESKGEQIESEGYYSMFHEMREKTYAPGSPLSAKDKMFSYLEHSELRWYEGHPRSLPKNKEQISQATGLTFRQIEAAALVLRKSKFIECINEKIDGVAQPTRYRLNKATFGIMHVPKKFELSVIHGGGLSNLSGGSTQIKGTVPSKSVDKLDDLPAKSSTCEDVNKGFKEQDLKNTTKTEIVELKGIPWKKAKPEILKKFPSDGPRLDVAFGQINTSNKFKNIEVVSPAGFILKGWQFMRDDYAYVDEIERQRNKVQQEDQPLPESTEEERLAAIEARQVIKKMIGGCVRAIR